MSFFFFSVIVSLYILTVSVPNSLPVTQLQARDFSDHWPQFKVPEPITSLAVCKNYVLCTDINDQVYYSDLSGLALCWVLLDYKASNVCVSYDGSIVCLLNKKSVYSLVNPSPKSKFDSFSLTWLEKILNLFLTVFRSHF